MGRKKATDIRVIRNPYAELRAPTVKQSATFAVMPQSPYHRFMHLEDFETLQRKYGESTSWVYIAATRLAATVGQIEWVVRRRDRLGQPDNRVTRNDGGLLQLMEKPNPFQSQYEFQNHIELALDLTGNCFIEKAQMDGRGRAQELYVLKTSNMDIIPDARTKVAGYVYRVNNTEIKFRPEQICHIKLEHPANDYFGLAPLTAARLAVDVDRAAAEWNKTFLLSGGWPVGAISSDATLDEEGEDRLRAELREALKGKDAAGRILILTGGLKFQNIGLTAKDMDWLDARRLSRDEILSIFGVPYAVAMLFSTEQTTARSAGVAQQVKDFYLFTVSPRLKLIAGAFNRDIIPAFSANFQYMPDLQSIPVLQEDIEAERMRADTYKTLVNSGWSPNRALSQVYPNVAPFPWGDVWWTNSAMVGIDGPVNPTLQSSDSTTETAVRSLYRDTTGVLTRVLKRAQSRS